MLRRIARSSIKATVLRRCFCTRPENPSSYGLFETSLEETDAKEIKRQRRNLGIRGTLDAEVKND